MIRNTKISNQFDMDEIYRKLRTSIEYSSVDNKIRVVNVTSSAPSEGKSTVSQNLARLYSKQYDKVLIIDCDLRKPTLHKKFGVSNKNGLTNLLYEFSENEKCLFEGNYFKQSRADESDKPLYILTSGSHVPNPQELLSSKMFAKVIELLKESFDFIILDCPPIGAVSDCIPVSHLADGTLFVISAEDNDKNEVKNALTTLKRNGVNVIGAVLNKVDAEETDSYGYYYSYK